MPLALNDKVNMLSNLIPQQPQSTFLLHLQVSCIPSPVSKVLLSVSLWWAAMAAKKRQYCKRQRDVLCSQRLISLTSTTGKTMENKSLGLRSN